MKKFTRFLSYVLVAAVASAVSFGLALGFFQGQPVSKLDQLEDLIQQVFIGEVDTKAIEDAAADAMVTALGDRWSYYMSAEEYQDYKERMKNVYVGVGITILTEEGTDGFQVIKVEENGPAKEAGLQVGDILTGAEGTSFTGMTASEAGDIVRGPEGTFVELEILREGQEMTFSVERRQVQVQVAKGTILEDGIGLVTIVNFDSRCAEETVAVIEELLDKGAQSLIFDVRNNPGGYKTELVNVLNYLLPEGALFRSEDYNGRVEVDQSDANCLEIPMAVLVNEDSYSAAEFFAAALSEYDAAVVVGTQTSGKGYFQNAYELNDGSAVGLSIGKYTTPNGVSLAEVGGLTPDVVVEVDEETFSMIYNGTLEPGEDPQIQAAVAELQK